MASLVGKSLLNGKYTLEQELGQGGFGVTYRAINHALNQFVVIKTVNEALRYDPKFADFQRHFQDEARRLARCSHPNIVRVSDFFVEDGSPYIVMDYIPGETLGNLVLPNNPLPEALALHYIRQVAEAVRAIHHTGLLHRDVKPQNVILREGTQQVVLIDFGIAREFTPGQTQTHTRIASDGYAPIEQYLPQAKRTSAIDVYGLAATLYTLLTAQIPVAAILRDRVQLSSPRELCPQLNAAVSEAVMRGMAVEPQHRPNTVDEWLMLLPNVLAYEPTVAATAGSISRMATTPVAPVYRPAPTNVAPVRTPQPQRSGSNWWLPGIVLLVAIASLGFALTRLLSGSSSAPSQEASPTPVPAATPVFPQSQPLESGITPSTPTPEASPSPTPDVAEPSPPDASPPTSESPAPELSPSPIEPTAPAPPEASPSVVPSSSPSPVGGTVTEPAPPPPSTAQPLNTQPSSPDQGTGEPSQEKQESPLPAGTTN
ncbi:MAG TPA: protein kinase [Crinalium sp.]|jgi:serine/threonine-protein kinase